MTQETMVPLNKKRTPFGVLSAASLRSLAMLCMLLDHMWASVVPGNNWMNYVGRIAFPLYAFQLVEGFFHTSDRKRYGKRLLLFALISEIPFNLLHVSSPVFPFQQNTIFTLFLGFWIISALEQLRQNRTWKQRLKTLLTVFIALLLSIIGFVDYGLTGVLTIILFYLCRFLPFSCLFQLIGMLCLHVIFFKGQTIPVFGYDFPTQGFALLALIPIWLYNGQKGRGGKVFQYTAYAFYPVHQIALYLIRSFM